MKRKLNKTGKCCSNAVPANFANVYVPVINIVQHTYQKKMDKLKQGTSRTLLQP